MRGVERVIAGVRRRLGPGTDRGGSLGRAGNDRGASAIEFVVLTPIMFFMIFAAVQFALYSFAEHVAKAAAQAGARTARAEADANPGTWAGSASEKSYDYLHQIGRGLFEGSPVVRVERPAEYTVRVTVTGNVPTIVPGMSLQVTAVSEGPVERFVPDGG
ncbi:TadE family protein [Streptomyces calidiresistens]|uniref:TadE family protein n=1 Tax=Streptomyces calidiresistens TaxID=1485586 RepID=UPI002B20A3DD|nr:TadE family protein [Streptomyces calidiresistens]